MSFDVTVPDGFARRPSGIAGGGAPDVSPRPTLLRSRPDPFSLTTRIPFETHATSEVAVEFFDVQGRLVRRMERAGLGAGRHELIWDGRNESGFRLGSGPYFYRLVVDGEVVSTRRTMLIR